MYKQINDKTGVLGEDFIEQYCNKHNILYKKATKEQDLKYGIDCFINDIPTDVKNSQDIYFLQILLNTNKINTRHPFKKNTKATQFCFVKVKDNISKGELKEIIDIKEKLLKDYIKDANALQSFYKQIQIWDNVSYKEINNNLEQVCLKVKFLLLSHCKEGITVSYPDISKADSEISFRLTKKKAIKKQVSKESLQNVLNNLKNNTFQKKELKQEIISITI